MTRRQRRLRLIAIAGATLAVAVGLVLFALEDQVVFFRTPSDIVAGVEAGQRIRIGGLVEAGSLAREGDTSVVFAVTDMANRVRVRYDGILPDLFREGQGVVAEGVVTGNGELIADTVLARHDETYMPREVVDALKTQGVWQHGDGAGTAAAGN